MKYISNQVNSIFIDWDVYSVGKSIWLPNSYKYNSETKSYLERFYKVEESKFLSCVVNYTEDCIRFTDSILLNINWFYSVNNYNINFKYTNFNLNNCKIKQNDLKTELRFEKGYICPWTGIEHTSNNCFISINHKDEHILTCYSDKCNRAQFKLELAESETI